MTARTLRRAATALLMATTLSGAPLIAFAQSTTSPVTPSPLAAPFPATTTNPSTAIPEATAPAMRSPGIGAPPSSPNRPTPGTAAPGGATLGTAPKDVGPIGGATKMSAPATAVPSTAQPATARGRQVNARVEERIRQLHARLKITAAQQSEWDSFTGVMRENAAHMDEVFAKRGDPKNMTAVEDLHAYATMAQAHEEDLQRLVPAFEQLYATFSPDQKKAADAAFRDFQRQEGGKTGRS